MSNICSLSLSERGQEWRNRRDDEYVEFKVTNRPVFIDSELLQQLMTVLV